MKTIAIATRPSPLALWQAEFVRSALAARHPKVEFTLRPIRTRGDTIVDRPLREIEGKALFIKEIEEAILRGEADMAVHCVKDFHTFIPNGFVLAAFLSRPSDRDVLLTRQPLGKIADLPHKAVVGTTSERRAYELVRQRPDLEIRPVRGNVGTRLARLQESAFDAIVLAEAGLERLGLTPSNILRLSSDEMMPAAGQGALAIETLAERDDVAELVAHLDDTDSRNRVLAERGFLKELNAGCGAAVGAMSRVLHRELQLNGFVGNRLTMSEVRGSIRGPVQDAALLGQRLARDLLERGASALL